MDAVMCAAFGGRADNIAAWLRRFPEWDLDRKDILFGNTASSVCVFFDGAAYINFQIYIHPISFYALTLDQSFSLFL